MIQVYIKENGKKIIIDVTQEQAECMQECRREAWRSDKKYINHCASLDEIESNGSIFADPALSPEDAYIEREEKQNEHNKLKVALKTLTKEQMQIVKMRFFKRMELKSIALKLGITYQSLQDRIKTILKKLKNNL